MTSALINRAVAAVALVLMACGPMSMGPGSATDAGMGSGSGADAGMDAGTDAGMGVTQDAGTDAGMACLAITGVAPSNGPGAGGTTVTLTGTCFVTGSTVMFGGVQATNVTFLSATSMRANTPAHAAGAVDVVVTVPSGVSTTLAGAYTYQ